MNLMLILLGTGKKVDLFFSISDEVLKDQMCATCFIKLTMLSQIHNNNNKINKEYIKSSDEVNLC